LNKPAYDLALASIRDSVPEGLRGEFDRQFAARMKSPSTAFILGILLGEFGVDRFYTGQPAAGALKLLAFLCFIFILCACLYRMAVLDEPPVQELLIAVAALIPVAVWSVADQFLIAGAVRRRNIVIARGIGDGIR
jgi:hypothetical protein